MYSNGQFFLENPLNLKWTARLFTLMSRRYVPRVLLDVVLEVVGKISMRQAFGEKSPQSFRIGLIVVRRLSVSPSLIAFTLHHALE